MADQQQNDNPVLRLGVIAFYFVVALSFPIVLFLLKGCFGSDQASNSVLEARAARVALAAEERQAGVDSAAVGKVKADVLEALAAKRGVVTSVVVPGSPTQLAGSEQGTEEASGGGKEGKAEASQPESQAPATKNAGASG